MSQEDGFPIMHNRNGGGMLPKHLQGKESEIEQADYNCLGE